MVKFFCRSCGAERELPFGWPADWLWCSDECHQDFARAVDHLMVGGEPGDIGVEPGSRLCSEALKEAAARRRAERVYARDLREEQFERSRPRPMRPLYPV